MSDYSWPPLTPADHAAIAADTRNWPDRRATADIEADPSDHIAEERKWERECGGVSGAEADRRADLYYGGAA